MLDVGCKKREEDKGWKDNREYVDRQRVQTRERKTVWEKRDYRCNMQKRHRVSFYILRERAPIQKQVKKRKDIGKRERDDIGKERDVRTYLYTWIERGPK